MSAARLREAAALMRERALGTSASPWDASGMWWYPVMEINEEGRAVDRPHGFHAACDAHGSGMVAHSALDKDATHIASWHPAVALAVADWLAGVALFVEAKDDEVYFDLDGDPIAAEDTHAIGCALAVANAYLGDPT